MPNIVEGNLAFDFDANVIASKYDDWTHYRNQFSRLPGTKAVDIVCFDRESSTGWLIEIKDYRGHVRTKPSDLPGEIALKVMHTLAGLVSAKFHATDSNERSLAANVLGSNKLRVVVHIEQVAKPSRLKPRIIEPADLMGKLKPYLKSVDPRLIVASLNEPASFVPWRVLPLR